MTAVLKLLLGPIGKAIWRWIKPFVGPLAGFIAGRASQRAKQKRKNLEAENQALKERNKQDANAGKLTGDDLRDALDE